MCIHTHSESNWHFRDAKQMLVLFQLPFKGLKLRAGRNEIFSCLTKLKGSKYFEGGKKQSDTEVQKVEPSFLNKVGKRLGLHSR